MTKEQIASLVARIRATETALIKRGDPQLLAYFQKVKQRYVKLGIPIWSHQT